MRALGAGAAVLLLLISPILLASTAAGSGAPVATTPVFAAPAHGPTSGSVPIPRELLSPFRNLSLPASHPATGPPPTSSYPETPTPLVPPTTPVVFTIAQGATSTPVFQDFTAPTGVWGAIVFNYTGTVVGGVYDSSYRAYVDENQILEGTTPEYGTWTVTKDLNEFASLFHGSVNVTFLLGAATLGGHFVTNITLSFYPVAPGTSPPVAPSMIVPIVPWNHTFLSLARGTLWGNATVPTNVTNATLQLFVYGFGPTDEFWYTAGPSYREAFVTVDQQPLGAVTPFPYINTGGIDLFLWRPLTGGYTIDDRPYEIDVSGSLGRIEGTHLYGMNISGGLGGGGNMWLLGGSLLLYTSPRAGPAASTLVATTGGGSTHSSGATFDDSSGSFLLRTASTFPLGNLTENVSTVLSTSFTNDQLLSQTMSGSMSSSVQNVSMQESVASSSWTNDSSGSWFESRNLDFPYVIDDLSTGNVLSSTSTTETIAFNTSLTNFHQEWRETERSGPVLSGWVNGPTTTVDDLTTGAGTYGGIETANKAGGGATINSISGMSSAIAKSFAWDLTNGAPSSSYLHQLSAAGTDPPGPFNAMPLLSNVVSRPLATAALGDPSTIDLGQHLTLSDHSVGGSGTYAYAWSGLPPGCSGADAPQLTCTPNAAGKYLPSVVVTDTSGSSVGAWAGAVLVEPPLNVSAFPDRTAWDVGQSLNVTALVHGGTGAGLRCQWSLNESTPGAATACDAPLVLSGEGEGPWSVAVTVTDSTGARATSALIALTLVAPPIASIAQSLSNTSRLFEAGLLQFNASVLGGSDPYSYTWSVGGVNQTVASSDTFLIGETEAQNVTVLVWVTDASGAVVESEPLTVQSGPIVPRAAPTAAGSGTTTDETGWYVALAAIAAAAVLGLLLAFRRPPPAPAPPRAPMNRPPTARPPGGPGSRAP